MAEDSNKPERAVVGIDSPPPASGTARLLRVVDGEELCAIQYGWDSDGRVLDLENVDTRKMHRRQGYPLEVLAALVATLPGDAVLRALGDHSCGGLRWLKRMRLEHAYQIHQNFWCFKSEDVCGRDRQGLPGDACPVDSDERLAQRSVL